MSRKDYTAFARVLGEVLADAIEAGPTAEHFVRRAVGRCCDVFQSENERFDRRVFERAVEEKAAMEAMERVVR